VPPNGLGEMEITTFNVTDGNMYFEAFIAAFSKSNIIDFGLSCGFKNFNG